MITTVKENESFQAPTSNDYYHELFLAFDEIHLSVALVKLGMSTDQILENDNEHNVASIDGESDGPHYIVVPTCQDKSFNNPDTDLIQNFSS